MGRRVGCQGAFHKNLHKGTLSSTCLNIGFQKPEVSAWPVLFCFIGKCLYQSVYLASVDKLQRVAALGPASCISCSSWAQRGCPAQLSHGLRCCRLPAWPAGYQVWNPWFINRVNEWPAFAVRINILGGNLSVCWSNGKRFPFNKVKAAASHKS